jgi:hypothetical protein
VVRTGRIAAARPPTAKRRGYTPPSGVFPFSVSIPPGRPILVELAPTLLTADRVTTFLPELLTTLFPADRIVFAFARTARVDPYAARSDVDALSDCRNGWDRQHAGRYQPAHDDVLHVGILSS